MFKFRIKILLVVIGLALLAIAVRLGYLQIVRGEDYRRQMEEELRSVDLLPAARGRILDRNGKILAMDEGTYDLCLDYRFLTDDPDWARYQQRRIARNEHVTLDEAKRIFEQRKKATWAMARAAAEAKDEDLGKQVRQIVRRVESLQQIIGTRPREAIQSHTVVAGLDEAHQATIRAGLEETIGASIRPARRRWYPQGDAAAHIIGLTGETNDNECRQLNYAAKGDDWLTQVRNNYLYGDHIGRSGVERLCEDALRGRRGYVRLRNDGDDVTADYTVPASNGEDVSMTLDIDLQKELASLIPAGKDGSIVIIDVPTGDILAMVSVPGYDLNTFGRKSVYKSLIDDCVHRPLLHRAVAGMYPPGSTAKPLAALTALSCGAINTGTMFYCRGYLFPDHPNAWRCFHSHAHGELNVTGGIRKSCNVFFYNVGMQTGLRRLREGYIRFGYGHVPGTGLAAEMPGRLPDPNDPSVTRGEVRLMAIGQGRTEASPLQVANAMATIARNGMFLSPRIVLNGGPVQQRRDLKLPAGGLRAVQKGMHEVTSEWGGTAYRIFHGNGIEPLGVEVCGKTGTATTSPQVLDGHIVRSGDTGWFAGYAPYRNPKIAFAVMLEYIDPEDTGGTSAGPVAREVLRACIRRGYLK